jgi:hypothetical protein
MTLNSFMNPTEGMDNPAEPMVTLEGLPFRFTYQKALVL